MAGLSLPVVVAQSRECVHDLTLDLLQTSQDVDLSLDTDTRPNLLVAGNEKVGSGVKTFSLPPVITCPTATPACLEACYAVGYVRRFPSVSLNYLRNLAAVRSPQFVHRMVGELLVSNTRVLRLHASGEFFDAEYVGKWVAIAKAVAAHGIVIYCYTRAWRSEAMRKSLTEFARQPNVRLWFSVDRDSRDVWVPSDKRAHVRIAYMAADNEDLPVAGTDLVFRVADRRLTTIKLAGVLVCPVENGTRAGANLTCESCKFCFKTAFERGGGHEHANKLGPPIAAGR